MNRIKNIDFKFSECKKKMGVEGLEPSRPRSQRILSPLCLPFHHTPLKLGGTQIRTGE